MERILLSGIRYSGRETWRSHVTEAWMAASPWISTGTFLICDVASCAFVFVYPISAWDLGVLFQFLNLRAHAFLHFWKIITHYFLKLPLPHSLHSPSGNNAHSLFCYVFCLFLCAALWVSSSVFSFYSLTLSSAGSSPAIEILILMSAFFN